MNIGKSIFKKVGVYFPSGTLERRSMITIMTPFYKCMKIKNLVELGNIIHHLRITHITINERIGRD